MAAALGMGLGTGDVAVSIGTSGTVYAVASTPTADPSGAVAGFADATGRFLPLVCTLNATKVTDAVARLLGVDLDELDDLALAEPAGSRRRRAPALPRRRAHPEPPRRPRGVSPGCGPTSTRHSWPAPRSKAWCAACSTASTPSPAPARSTTGRLVLVGGGARSAAYRQILADLSGRPVHVAAEAEHVATGAAVQAASVLHQRPAAELVAAWGLAAGEAVEPGPGAAAAADVRAAYAGAA